MTIDMLDRKTILVNLQQEDMREYALDFQSREDADKVRRGLTELLIRIGEECRLDHRGKSYLIEALPARESCLLIISVRRTHRKKYRIKRENTRTICTFDTADMLLDWMESDHANAFSYQLYRYHERYILLPFLNTPTSTLASLSEYGCLTPASSVIAARIQEYGTLLKEIRAPHRQFAKRVSSAAT